MFEKITDEDLQNKGVSGLPDTPDMSAADLQARFDSLALLAINKLNELVEKLSSASASSNIGIMYQTSHITVQNALVKLLDSLDTINNAIKKIREDDHSLGTHTHDTRYFQKQEVTEMLDEVVSKIDEVKRNITSQFDDIYLKVENGKLCYSSDLGKTFKPVSTTTITYDESTGHLVVRES